MDRAMQDFLTMHQIVSVVAVPQNALLVEPFIQKTKVRFRNFTVFRNNASETGRRIQKLDAGFRN